MDIRKMIDKVRDFGKIIVYTCVDGVYDKNKKPIDYFAVNLDYAKKFADNCYKVTLQLNGYNILDLEEWNNIYTQKTGLNGNKYNRKQGIFVIGEENLATNYEEPISRFRMALGDNIADKFIDELNTCDAVYGEDAGYREFVYAVINKDMILNFKLLNQ